MLAQAAMHGMGVALIPPFLIRDELASGRLMIANPRSFDSSNAYYLVIPERKAESATLQAFRDWVIGEAQAYGQELAPSRSAWTGLVGAALAANGPDRTASRASPLPQSQR